MSDPKQRSDQFANKTTAKAEEPSSFDRRAILAGGVGATVALAPLAVGAVVFFDPLREQPAERRRPAMIEVCKIDDIPEDGTPVLKPVRADDWDQWTFTPNDLLGSVYLRRMPGRDAPVCFNSICPHAGCRVSFNGAKDAEQQLFVCPCHNSAFNLDGSTHGRTPSPRALDELRCEVKDGVVFVEFKNFYAGQPERVEKA
jgi:Rieske Fe-S protein